MARMRTLGAVVLLALSLSGCGNSAPTEDPRHTAVATLEFPDPVVAVLSTDPQLAMEASVPFVIRETTGQGGAAIDWIQIAVIDEATGMLANPSPRITFANPRFVGYPMVDPVPLYPGGTVEAPFRVGLHGSGTYRVEVMVNAWTSVPRSQYLEQTQYRGSFRIVPPR